MTKEFNQAEEMKHLQSKYAMDEAFSKKEFNLSEKRKWLMGFMQGLEGVSVKNINKIMEVVFEQDKEFIKLLKEEIGNEFPINSTIRKHAMKLFIKINKLAGDDLI